MLNHRVRVDVCVSMYEVFVKDDVERKNRMKCILPLFSGPHFFFVCCKLHIDHVASLTLLAFGRPTRLGFCLLVQRVFLFMTPVDVFFIGGGAEEAVD